MSGGLACKNKEHRKWWRVTDRNHNRSAFNGYHYTPSDYSRIICTVRHCTGCWRSKAPFVASIPDLSVAERFTYNNLYYLFDPAQGEKP